MQKLRPLRSVGRLAVVALAVVGLSASSLAVSPGDDLTMTAPASSAQTPGPAAADPVAPTTPATTPAPAPGESVGPDETVLGPAAVEAIGDDLDEVAAVNELTTDELVAALQDPTYGVGKDGRLFVAEFLDAEHAADHTDHAEADGAAGSGPVALAAVVPLDRTFTLSSLPGSSRTIFLDFDGHTLTDTVWNERQGIPNGRTVPPFSLDGSNAFSTAELEYIQNVWLAVSEDYAPFDVNVTTQAPPAGALTRSNNNDQTYGARAIITSPNVQSDFPSSCPITSSCAGLAYVNVFDATGLARDVDENLVPAHPYYEGAFVNADGVSSPLALTTIISHEVGHNGGLNHAGFNSQEYYSGTGNWGPIMGTPYARALSQWTNHSYSGANNPAAADLAVLASHGLAPRADDAGATIATAAPSGWTTSRPGLISTPTDLDMWSLGRCTGSVTITATPSTYSTNLDVSLSLYTANGTAGVSLASNDPASGQSGSGSSMRATGVSASVTATANGAPYYAQVSGSPSGPDEGYGNLGPYTLSAVCDGVSTPPPGMASFTDVPASATFFTQIEWLAARAISTGYDNGNGTKRFEPSGPVLREQMAAFLYRFAGATQSATSCGLLDVAPSQTFAKQICWLRGTGITTGYDVPGGVEFRGSQPVLREQMAAFLYRLAGSPDDTPSASCSFADVPANHVFRTAICWLAAEEISTGYAETNGSTTFRPGQPVLREQMAAFLFRYDAAGLPVIDTP